MSTNATTSSSSSGMPASSPLTAIFQSKYDEFCDDLGVTFPELSNQIKDAYLLSPENRIIQYVEKVLPHTGPERDASNCPGEVLPGVILTETLWAQLSKNNKKVIQEYLTILSLCSLYDSAKEHIFDISGNRLPFGKEWSQSFMNEWKSKLNGTNFAEISGKIADFFKDPGSFPTLPEKFMKGHIMKLAMEIVQEFKPEDFGITEEKAKDLNSVENAFQLMMEMYTKDSSKIMNAIQRVVKRLASKFQNGEIRPEQIVHEAEELISSMSDNPAIVELMETFRDAFGMADMTTMRAAGREGDARRNLVKERLKKKLEAKKAAGK